VGFRPPKRLQRLSSLPGQPVIPYIMCERCGVGGVGGEALARDEQMEAIGCALQHTCRRWCGDGGKGWEGSDVQGLVRVLRQG